jgi:hypothetical protein
MEALGFVCVGLIVGIVIGLAIGAVILRTACHFAGVPVPSFGSAMGVVFVVGLVMALANTAVQFVLGMALGGQGGREDPTTALLSLAVIFPMDFVIAAGLYSSMLEKVSFAKGLLIHLIQFIIGIVIVVVIVGVMLAVGVGGSMLKH